MKRERLWLQWEEARELAPLKVGAVEGWTVVKALWEMGLVTESI